LNIQYLGKSDVQSSGIPSNKAVDNFLDESFDVLIDLTQCMQPVIHWIICLSAAHLKIGTPARINQHIFDISIESEHHQTQENMMKLAVQFQNMFQNKPL
jgi:hypothetical protein